MKNAKTILFAFAIAGSVSVAPLAMAINSPQPSLLEEKADKGKPFKGKIEAVDAAAKTFTVDGKAILVSDATKLKKEGKEITLAELKVGDQVHGKTRQNSEGKLEAIHVEVGEPKK